MTEHKKKIMVVDDDPIVGQMVARGLDQLRSVETTYYDDPIRALSDLHLLRPDLILLDWMMPQMDGMAFIKKMALMERRYPIPVFMLTGKSTGHDFETACDAGVVGYLTKPVRLGVLRTRVYNYLQNNSRVGRRI